MISLRLAEVICKKSDITLEEVHQLQELQNHIVRWEDPNNKRIKNLSRRIDQKISDFFCFDDDMFDI